jgi:hypothetical protein
MSANPLPIEVQYVQALGFPVVGSAIAIIGAWIAFQQMKTARSKLRHDLYERRYPVFAAARDLLAEIVRHDTPSAGAIGEYYIKTADASFHFNDEALIKYIENIGALASALLVDVQTLEGEQIKDENVEKRIRDNRRWLQNQIQKRELAKVFQGYLAHAER